MKNYSYKSSEGHLENDLDFTGHLKVTFKMEAPFLTLKIKRARNFMIRHIVTFSRCICFFDDTASTLQNNLES